MTASVIGRGQTEQLGITHVLLGLFQDQEIGTDGVLEHGLTILSRSEAVKFTSRRERSHFISRGARAARQNAGGTPAQQTSYTHSRGSGGDSTRTIQLNELRT